MISLQTAWQNLQLVKVSKHRMVKKAMVMESEKMKAIEVIGIIDSEGNLILDEPIRGEISPSRVRVILLFTEKAESLVDPDDTPIEDVKASLRRALQQASSGQTMPISELWSGIDAEWTKRNNFVYKVRIRNSNIQKGKSAGYRMIYQVESSTSVLLLTIYAKSDREDISVNEILDILAEFKRE